MLWLPTLVAGLYAIWKLFQRADFETARGSGEKSVAYQGDESSTGDLHGCYSERKEERSRDWRTENGNAVPMMLVVAFGFFGPLKLCNSVTNPMLTHHLQTIWCIFVYTIQPHIPPSNRLQYDFH